MKKLKIIWVILLSFLAVACNQTPTENTAEKFVQQFKTMLVYPKKNLINDFKLVKSDLSVFDQKSLKDHWNLLFLGFTNCPDICPTTLTDMTNIYKKIQPENQKKLQILFLSVDPDRDTPQHIGQYISYFHDDLVGITGEKAEIDKLVSAIGGIYSLNRSEGEFYSVDHSARIFIINPKGERYGMVTSEAMLNKDKSLLVKELELMIESRID